MKIAIISDLHIGQTLYRNTDDGINKFESILYDKLKEYTQECKKADLVIICGDVFHKPNPSVLAIKAFKEMVDELPNLKIITGNHDINTLLENKNTNAISLFTENIKPHSIDYDNVRFHFLPWGYKEDFDLGEYNVLIAHGTTETYTNKFNLNIHFEIEDEYVKQFDIAFIGHIHNYEEYKIGKTKVFSVGSMINHVYDKSNTGILWFDTETKEITRQLIETPYTIKLTTDTLDIPISNNIYKITYTGNIDDIDEDKYEELRKTSLSLTLELPKEETTIEENFTSDFMTWLKENYEDYLIYFKGE